MKRRIREKKLIQSALKSSGIVFGDIHGEEPRLNKKIRLAVERQIKQRMLKETL